MGIITKSSIRNYSNSLPSYRSATMLFSEAHKNDRSTYTTSVFLSHSHLDAEYVKDIVAFLRSQGVSCYVDWMDDTMPEMTNGVTAAKIKEKIRSNKKFIFLATNNSVVSKWCNWEIGYGDSLKYLENIAIFPLKESYGEWKGNEYLQLYPYIYESDVTPGTYWVHRIDNSAVRLQDWLKI